MILYICKRKENKTFMSKDEYRSYFVQCMKLIKITHLLQIASIPRTNFSKFINDNSQYGNALISIERLELLHQLLVTELKKLIT